MAAGTRRKMWECEEEERLPLERGGRVIVFFQDSTYFKSSLGSLLLYVCPWLLRHIAAASGPGLHRAISCVCVCVSLCESVSLYT